MLKGGLPEHEYFAIQTVTAFENDDRGIEYKNSLRKLTLNLNDMFWDLNYTYGSAVLSERRTQVLGMLEQGPALSTY